MMHEYSTTSKLHLHICRVQRRVERIENALNTIFFILCGVVLIVLLQLGGGVFLTKDGIVSRPLVHISLWPHYDDHVKERLYDYSGSNFIDLEPTNSLSRIRQKRKNASVKRSRLQDGQSRQLLLLNDQDQRTKDKRSSALQKTSRDNSLRSMIEQDRVSFDRNNNNKLPFRKRFVKNITINHSRKKLPTSNKVKDKAMRRDLHRQQERSDTEGDMSSRSEKLKKRKAENLSDSERRSSQRGGKDSYMDHMYHYVSKRQLLKLSSTTSSKTTASSSSTNDGLSDGVDCYPSDSIESSMKKHSGQCPDEHDVLLEIEMKFDHTSPDFSWRLRNETIGRSGPDVDNILLQIQSNQYKESNRVLRENLSSQIANTSAISTSTCTYAICLPQETNNHDALYSLTLLNRHQNGMPCPSKEEESNECYSVKVNGEIILSGGNFNVITSRWFKYSLSGSNTPNSSAEQNIPQTHNDGTNSTTDVNSTMGTQGIGQGKWVEIPYVASKCNEDDIWDGELFSPVSGSTEYRFHRRIFELIQVATSVSGAHDLWTNSHRRRALCWLLHDDKRQISSNDPLLVQRYAMAVVFYSTMAQNDWIYNDTFHHSGNECDWFMKKEWNDSCSLAERNTGNDENDAEEAINNNEDDDDVKNNNNNNENQHKGIPKSNIRTIHAYQATLHGTLPHEMFTGLKYLEIIELAYGNLFGTIPSQIGSSKKLRMLSLARNDLSGTIPSNIGHLPALNAVHLDVNQLKGTIPPGLFRQTISNITELVLYKNQLEGKIPSDIGNAVQLTGINLGFNNLTGTIPIDLFTNCTKLRFLSFPSNSLSGTLPDEIQNLKHIEEVFLDKNMLHGRLPSGLGLLPLLRILNLEDNHFEGTLLKDIGSATNLKWLLLSNNRLVGAVPKEIGEWTNISKLELSGNQLMGEIPSSLWNLTFESLDLFVPRLDLHNNTEYLRGQVPSDFCNKLPEDRVIVDDSSWMRAPRINCSCCNTCDEGGIQIRGGIGSSGGNNNKNNCPHHNATRIHVTFSDDFEIVDVENNRTIYSEIFQNNFPSTFYVEEDREICLPVMGCYRAIFYTYHEGGTVFVPPFRIKHKGVVLAEQDFREGSINETSITIEFGLSMVKNNQSMFSIMGPEVLALDAGSCEPVRQICDGMAFDSVSPERRILNHISHYGTMGEQGIPLLFNSDSPRAKALCFVARGGTLRKGQPQLTQQELEEQICTGQLLQRYVLALLMFNNHAWEEEELVAKSKQGYPSSVKRSPYCLWPGITCADYGHQFSIVTEIDLSNRNLSGTLPPELSLLNGLEALLLNNNDLSGTMPNDVMPSFPLKRLNLGYNRLSGTLHTSFLSAVSGLEELDLSHNLLAGTLELLSDNKWDLQHLDLSDNYFTGTLPDEIFKSMPGSLKYIDLSKNGLQGTLPSYPLSHPFLDTLSLHENSFSGSIPSWLFTSLPHLTTLWLHSNRLTGSIPTEIGLAQRLTSISLSYNELRGTVPKQLEQLDKRKQLKKLLLQGNSLTGSDTPFMGFLKSLGGDAFISDCGNPFYLLPSKLDCSSCTVCCNSNKICQINTSYQMSIIIQTAIFLGAIFAFLAAFCITVVLVRRTTRMSRSTPTTQIPQGHRRRLQNLCGVRSVYSFLLSSSYAGWIIYLITYMSQIMIFVIFLNPADFRHENSDWQYDKRCPANSLDCKDESDVTAFGWFIFTVVLSSKLAVDIFNGFLLLHRACIIKNITHKSQERRGGCTTRITLRLLVSGFALVLITSLAAWTSVVYNRATATADTELVYNAVILLVVNELDELVYALVATLAPLWLKERNKEMEDLDNEMPKRNGSDDHAFLPVSTIEPSNTSQHRRRNEPSNNGSDDLIQASPSSQTRQDADEFDPSST